MNRTPQQMLVERLVPFLFILAVVVITGMTLLPFLPSILWGAMVAIAMEPRYRWLVARLNGRRILAAWLLGIFLTLVFLLPMIGLARALLAYLPGALNWVERAQLAIPGLTPEKISQLPAIGPPIAELWRSLFSDASNLASRFGSELKGVLVWLLQEFEVLGFFVFEFAIGIALAIVFILRSARISHLAELFFDRIGGQFALRLAEHSVMTTRLAVRGVLGAALAQTIVATFSYVVAGVPGWIIWSGITFIFSLVQVGPVVVWVPMSIWLWSTGAPYMALFVAVWGAVVVNLTDNFVRPYLVSKDSDLPAWLAFLGALGGLMEWGVIGVFLGPVIVAVGYELIVKWLEPETLLEKGDLETDPNGG